MPSWLVQTKLHPPDQAHLPTSEGEAFPLKPGKPTHWVMSSLSDGFVLDLVPLSFGSGREGFPSESVVKKLPADVGDVGSVSGSGRSPGEGNGNPLQYSCLENPMDRGAWPAAVHGVTSVRHQ